MTMRQTVRHQVIPRVRKIGKLYINDLDFKRHERAIAKGLIDLGANILDRILADKPPPEPQPNPMEEMTEAELMDELARRTGRRIILAQQQSETDGPSSKNG